MLGWCITIAAAVLIPLAGHVGIVKIRADSSKKDEDLSH